MVYNRERQPHYQLRLFVQRTLSTFACRDCRVYFVLCALLWRFAFLCFVRGALCAASPACPLIFFK